MFWQFAFTIINIQWNSNAFLIVDCRIDKRDYSIDIIFRLREFRRRFANWKEYFVSITNVFNSRKTARFKLFNLWTKKIQKIFFEFKYVFSKLSCFVYNWFVKWACSFIFFRMTKRMKTTFVLENKQWLIIIWFFDEFFFFYFCDFLIFFLIFESFIFLRYHFLSLFLCFFK